MSRESAVEFFNKAAQNPRLREWIQQATSAEHVLHIAREQGYALTIADIKAIAEAMTPDFSELSEGELEAIAGGSGWPGSVGLAANAIGTVDMIIGLFVREQES